MNTTDRFFEAIRSGDTRGIIALLEEHPELVHAKDNRRVYTLDLCHIL